ncbi:MAG: hypothetical protein J6T92_02855 [Ottowia sp.]|nr:hypothetical protein [Ottowia sp.]
MAVGLPERSAQQEKPEQRGRKNVGKCGSPVAEKAPRCLVAGGAPALRLPAKGAIMAAPQAARHALQKKKRRQRVGSAGGA